MSTLSFGPGCIRALLAARRGETALEFGILGMVFILLLLAPIEVGLMIWTGSTLQATAAQTARCAAIGSSMCTDPKAYAVALAGQWIGPNVISAQNVTVATTTTCHSATGNFEQVIITASIWSGTLLSPIAAGTQTVSACFPL